MIVRLRGILEDVNGNTAVVAPEGGGMAYEVLLPAYYAQRLTAGDGGMIGQPITLYTTQYLESVGQGTSFVPRILGFASPREREFFSLFTSVKGLGAKRALRALAIEPGEIAAAILARDARTLQKLPEIGKRLAETMIVELTGKVDTYADLSTRPEGSRIGAAAAAAARRDPAFEDAVTALVALGESRPEAERMVTRAVQKDPGLKTTEQILQGALAAR